MQRIKTFSIVFAFFVAPITCSGCDPAPQPEQVSPSASTPAMASATPKADLQPDIDKKFSLQQRKDFYYSITPLIYADDSEKRMRDFGRKHRLTNKQMSEINAEGIENEWPTPK